MVDLLSLLGDAMATAVDTMTAGVQWVQDKVSQAYNLITGAVSSAIDTVLGVKDTVTTAVNRVITDLPGAVVDTVDKGKNEVVKTVTQVVDQVTTVVQNTYTTVMTDLSRVWSAINNIIPQVQTWIKDNLDALVNGLLAAGSAIGRTIWTWIDNALGEIRAVLNAVDIWAVNQVHNLTDTLSNLAGQVANIIKAATDEAARVNTALTDLQKAEEAWVTENLLRLLLEALDRVVT